ncbi:hypothetical protein DSO57_1017700 [Entomophthora muscae]|uniref:Uncharacterized protein n=1 Tax=Entomophthora muscae TaxID=34485 RepID=A0ACC2U3Y5_9FUNG|nr:hypothetical protein DSO57_1017700 [Entomophthora muscae]
MEFVSKLFNWLESLDKLKLENGYLNKPMLTNEEEVVNSLKSQNQQSAAAFLVTPNPIKSEVQNFYVEKSNTWVPSPGKNYIHWSCQALQCCPDYEEKGFCLKAESCPFSHGADVIALNNTDLYNKKVHNPSNLDSIDNSKKSMQDDYDPSSPYVGGHHRGYSQGSNSYCGHCGGFQHNRGNQHYPVVNSYSQRGYFANSSTVLVLQNIPNERYSQEFIKEYFNRFGEVSSVELDKYQLKAEIEFKTEDVALKAYTFPEPIFGNRFVKLYWKHLPNKHTPMLQGRHHVSTAPNPEAELARKQHLLHKKKTEFVAKQLEEQKKLLELVDNPNLSGEDRKSMLASLNNITTYISETLTSLSKSNQLEKSVSIKTEEPIKTNFAHRPMKKTTLPPTNGPPK